MSDRSRKTARRPSRPRCAESRFLEKLAGLSGLPAQETQPFLRSLLRAGEPLAWTQDLTLLPELDSQDPPEFSAFLSLFAKLSYRYDGLYSYRRRRLHTVAALRELLDVHLRGATDERFFLLCEDEYSYLLGTVELSQRDSSQIAVSLPSLGRFALRHRSAGITLVHNHPDGAAQFSDMDLASTLRFQDYFRELGVLVTDHFLFAGDRVVSLRGLADPAQSGPLPPEEPGSEAPERLRAFLAPAQV